MTKTILILLLFFGFHCGGDPLTVIDATAQSFTGGREQSTSGMILTVYLQAKRPSHRLHIENLVVLGDTFPAVLRHPATGDLIRRFQRKDTLLIKVTVTQITFSRQEKDFTAFVEYKTGKKEKTLAIQKFRQLPEQIRR
ncbi:MAG: hypothetical protein GXO83_01545 [Chlorobi bacterium]|nr:hypothetical protein [Chlorobiota bacterium]